MTDQEQRLMERLDRRDQRIDELRAALKTSICERLVESIDMAKLMKESARLRAALTEVMSWIDNWSPSFIGDDEWPEAGKRARAALPPIAPPPEGSET